MPLTKLITSTAIALFTLAAAPAFAGDATLTIRDFIGTVTVNTSPSADLRVTDKSNSRDIKIKESRGSLVIDGRIDDLDGDGCKNYYGNMSWSLFGKKEKSEQVGGYKDLEDYPILTISAPDDVKLIIENAIPFGEAGDIGSADIDLRHCGRYAVGNIRDHADIRVTGSGDFKALDIGSLDAKVTGSGDLDFENTGDADLVSTGSGSIDFENAGNVTLKSSGSSDIEMEDIAGRLTVTSSGSSDISVGNINGGLSYIGGGSGDITIDELNGDADISVGGSGDVDIDDGNINDLIIKAGGSSDVNYGGTADTATLTARGSSDINVHDVTGVAEQKTSGSADINVNR